MTHVLCFFFRFPHWKRQKECDFSQPIDSISKLAHRNLPGRKDMVVANIIDSNAT